jgi:hypothetical protein
VSRVRAAARFARLERRWRPTRARPREGWEVLPPLRWVLLGGAAAVVLLVLSLAAALADG